MIYRHTQRGRLPPVLSVVGALVMAGVLAAARQPLVILALLPILGIVGVFSRMTIELLARGVGYPHHAARHALQRRRHRRGGDPPSLRPPLPPGHRRAGRASRRASPGRRGDDALNFRDSTYEFWKD